MGQTNNWSILILPWQKESRATAWQCLLWHWRRCSVGSSQMPGLKGYKWATAFLLNNHCPPNTATEPEHTTHRSALPVFWPNSKLLLTLYTWCSIPRLAADPGVCKALGMLKITRLEGREGKGQEKSKRKCCKLVSVLSCGALPITVGCSATGRSTPS